MKFSSSRKITLEPLPELSHIIRSFFIKNKIKSYMIHGDQFQTEDHFGSQDQQYL